MLAEQRSSTATRTQVAASLTAVDLMAANTLRQGGTIYYDGAAILYLGEGATVPTSSNYTVKLGAGLFTAYEVPIGFTAVIRGIWSSAAGSAIVTERT